MQRRVICDRLSRTDVCGKMRKYKLCELCVSAVRMKAKEVRPLEMFIDLRRKE
jgi:hypothetical protein